MESKPVKEKKEEIIHIFNSYNNIRSEKEFDNRRIC